MEKVERTDAEWRERLTPAEYAVLRQAGTERVFTGEYTDTESTGVYRCKACRCGNCSVPMPSSTRGAGGRRCTRPTWSDDAVTLIERNSARHGMIRVQRRARRDSHPWHVFTGEGYTTPTDERWCINSVSLTLEPKEPAEG